MADIMTRKERSKRMSLIRSINTKPEIVVRKFLFSKGFRYTLHDRNLPGSPDIVLPKHKVVIQVRGCFWHFHYNCKHARLPKSNKKFWREKLKKNKSRDITKDASLRRLGWKVTILWECQIMNNKKFERTKIRLIKIFD